MFNKKTIYALLSAMLLLGASSFGRDLEALQKQYLSWKFGMFIHFNMSTFVPGGWSTGLEDPLKFNPTEMDFGQWADAAVSAHMKYGVLTVKHTGGWCLWDSATTDHDITSLTNYKNGKGDMVREFTEAFRSRNLKVGLYYCFPLGVSRWANYSTLPVEGYAEGKADALSFIKKQFTELLTNYGKIDLVWIDQSRSKNGGLKPGDWIKVKNHIHSLQPDCIVVANNQLDYSVTDIHSYEYPYSLNLPPKGNPYPAEVCDKLQQGWFINPGDNVGPVRDVDYVVNKMLRPLNDNNANYLLNCSPDTRGLLPESVVVLLKNVGEAWSPDEASKANTESYGIIREVLRQVPNKVDAIALTFNASTDPALFESITAILSKYDAQGTFFVTEATLKSAPETITQLTRQLHEIGNGSKSGTNDLTQLEKARDVRNEVEPIQKEVQKLVKTKPLAFRAPKNAYDDKVWNVLNYQDMVPAGASVTMSDLTNIEEQIQQIESGSIIEIAVNKDTLGQLETLMATLQEKGFELVSLRNLLKNSTSERLRSWTGKNEADVVTGME